MKKKLKIFSRGRINMGVFSFIVLILCSINSISAVEVTTDMSRLREKILDNYDVHSRPTQKHNESTFIELSFYFNGFDLNEDRNFLSLFLVTVMSWYDQHVEWDPQMYGNITQVFFTNKELWTPDLAVLNNFDQSEINIFGDSRMIGMPNSFIWWLPYTKFRSYCALDFTLWPYDTQTCKVHLASWSHEGDEVDIQLRMNISELIIDASWVDHHNENKEWKVLRTNVSRHAEEIYCCPEVSDVEIIIEVSFMRKSSTHTVAITVVGIGIATAILISFWLDPFAQERMPVSLLILLLNALYIQQLHKAIPNNGSKVPLSICFFRDSLIMVTVAFAWTVGIRYLAKIQRDVPLPSFIETFLDSCAANVLCLNTRSEESKGQHGSDWNSGDDGDPSGLIGGSSVKQDWEWLARFFDRLAFFAYLITYLVFLFRFL